MFKLILAFILGGICSFQLNDYLESIKFNKRLLLLNTLELSIIKDKDFDFVKKYNLVSRNESENKMIEVYAIDLTRKVELSYIQKANIGYIPIAIKYTKSEEIHRDLYEGPAVIEYDGNANIIKSEYWIEDELIKTFDHNQGRYL